VIAYSVARRTREIGIRMALGARPGALLGLVMRQGLGLAAVGLGIGCVLAAGAARLLGSLLYGVSASDPLPWSLAAVALLAVAAIANLVPAGRAVRVNPTSALRSE
jgi:putative ABC transport system permease protein